MKKSFTFLLILLCNFYIGQNAIQFNGTNAYVTFGNNPNLGLSQFSIECWFKRLGSGSITSFIVCVGQPANLNVGAANITNKES